MTETARPLAAPLAPAASRSRRARPDWWLQRWPALPVFLATLAVYCALVPWLARVWARSGDEPHYLLAAHSLVADGDLDLANNYAQRDYAAFYNEFYLNPHVRLRADGQQVLTHNLGLSFLIAPAYALGGYSGVLYFLAGVGALLAAQVYGLCFDLTRRRAAALVGWLAVMFTPPVLWYVFLVYPELTAALALLTATRLALQGSPYFPGFTLARPKPSNDTSRTTKLNAGALSHAPTRSRAHPLSLAHALLFGLSLALLPWLSSRFLPPMGLLIAWALWRAWHERRRRWLVGALLALGGLGGYMLFSFWLYGSASPAASYAGPTPLAVEQSFVLLRVARGLLGWLFDTQRGLFISAPIYLVALWGCVVLLFRRPLTGLAVLAPFGASLLPVAVWGGFWLGWEYSARFLIAALPLLSVGVAYLWAAGRKWVIAPVSVALFAFSLWAGWQVIEQPLRGIISSPIEQLKPRLNLEHVIPAMARYAFIPAGREAVVGRALAAEPAVSPSGGAVTTALTSGPTWETAVGESGLVLRQVDLPEWTFGWFSARLPLVAPGAPPDTPVARLRIFSPTSGDYYAATLLARDLPADGVYRFSFFSPPYNGWGHPPTILVSSTGQADLRLGLLTIEPDLFHSLGLAALWLVGVTVLGGVVVGLALAGAPRPVPAAAEPGTPNRRLALNATLFVLAVASLAWSLLPQSRTYPTIAQQRTVGDVVPDPAAYHGQTMQAQPARGHEPGRLAYTQPEQYAAGRYTLTISLAALPVDHPLDPAALLASVRVFSSDAALLAQRWDITARDLPADGQYYSLTFTFENPTDAALTFVLDYTGAAGLKSDRFIVTPGR